MCHWYLEAIVLRPGHVGYHSTDLTGRLKILSSTPWLTGSALHHVSLQTRTGGELAAALTNQDLTALHGRASWQQAVHHEPLSFGLLPAPSPAPLGLADDSHQHFQEFHLLPGLDGR